MEVNFYQMNSRSICEETGLERHYTSPYSPQQNGVVERRNRTVLEMVRCNIKTISMPNVLKVEVVACLYSKHSPNEGPERHDPI